MTFFKNGDPITITCEGRTVDGRIEIISENQVSAMITFEAVLGAHAGTMPIFLHDDGVYRSIIDGSEVTIKRRQ